MNVAKPMQRTENATSGKPLDSGEDASDSLWSLWSAPPLHEAYLSHMALSGGRIWLLFIGLGWVWAAFVNYDRPWVVASFSILLLFMTAITSPRIKLGARVRLGGLAAVIILLAEVAFVNNGDVVIGCLMVMPAAIVITTAFGGRHGIVVLILVNGSILWQAHFFGFQPLDYLLRMVPLAMVWSLLLATWTMMLVRQIDSYAQRIQLLRDNERKTYTSINQELAEPLGVLSRLAQSPQLDSRGTQTLRSAAETLSHTVANLGPALDASPDRPTALESFCPATVAAQLRVQHSPAMERWGKTLVADASDSAQLLVKGDLFRLRIILSNMLRTASILSDGSILWLNVRGAIEGANTLITFDVESNGYPMDIGSLASMLEDDVDAEPGAATSVAGLRLAKVWVEQMGGRLELFNSPRGGNGFRVTQIYESEPCANDLAPVSSENAGDSSASLPKTAAAG